MSQNGKNFAAILIVILLIALGLQLYHAYAVTDVYEYGQSYIPTITQLQQALIDTGIERYDPCGVDGIVGKRTIAAWEVYSFDQYAAECFEGK